MEGIKSLWISVLGIVATILGVLLFVREDTVTAAYLAGRRPEALVDPETTQMI